MTQPQSYLAIVTSDPLHFARYPLEPEGSSSDFDIALPEVDVKAERGVSYNVTIYALGHDCYVVSALHRLPEMYRDWIPSATSTFIIRGHKARRIKGQVQVLDQHPSQRHLLLLLASRRAAGRSRREDQISIVSVGSQNITIYYESGWIVRAEEQSPLTATLPGWYPFALEDIQFNMLGLAKRTEERWIDLPPADTKQRFVPGMRSTPSAGLRAGQRCEYRPWGWYIAEEVPLGKQWNVDGTVSADRGPYGTYRGYMLLSGVHKQILPSTHVDDVVITFTTEDNTLHLGHGRTVPEFIGDMDELAVRDDIIGSLIDTVDLQNYDPVELRHMLTDAMTPDLASYALGYYIPVPL